jgi:predicted  nucleic acid-binding Zn-ribbon protein
MRMLYTITLSIILATTVTVGCKRTDSVPQIQTSNMEAELDRLRAERDDKIDELRDQSSEQAVKITELNLERDQLNDQKTRLEQDIESLRTQLTQNQTLTAQQKTTMEAQLAALQNEKNLNDAKLKSNEAELTKAMERIKELNTEVTNLKAEISRLNSRIIELENQLAAERAKNATTTQSAPASTATTPSTSTSTTTTGAAKTYSTFRYIAKADCLAIPGASTADNTQLSALPCAAANTQHFETPNSATSTFFSIISRSSEKCVGLIAGAGTTENAAVVQKSCVNGAADQQWEFFVRGEANFRLRNLASGKCMKIQADGKIVQGDCATNATYFSWSRVP